MKKIFLMQMMFGLIPLISAENVQKSLQLGEFQFKVGLSHSNSVRTNGQLWSWGNNSLSQYGNNDTLSQALPTIMTGAQSWLMNTVGLDFSVAIASDSSLWSWGKNDAFGRLGVGGNSSSKTTPFQVSSQKWIFVQSENSSSFALKSDSTLWSWGENTYGQLGFPQSIAYVPIQVGSAKWLLVSLGGNQGLGIQKDSTLWAWGNNDYGQLGDSSFNFKKNPVRIGDTQSRWLFATSGFNHTLAIQANGSLWGWGENSKSQLALKDSLYNKPQLISAQSWRWASAGLDHSLAIASDSTLWIWGNNQYGQLGLGLDDTASVSIPTQLGLEKWLWVKAGSQVSYGLKADSTIWVWGDNRRGQLGIGHYYPQNKPIQLGFKTQTIQFDSISNQVYGVDSILLQANASTGGKVDFKSLNDSICIIKNNKLLPRSVGNCEILARQNGNSEYLGVSQNRQFLISPHPLVVQALGQQKVYGESDPLFKYTVQGFVYQEDSTVLSGALSRDSGDNVGAYLIRKGNLNAKNYLIQFLPDTLKITPKPLIIVPTQLQKVYGDTNSFAWTANGLLPGDSLQGQISRQNGENVGVYAYNLGYLSSNNYKLSIQESLQVIPRNLNVVASSQSKIYGADDPHLSFTASGYAFNENSDVFSGVLSRDTGKKVGDYSIRLGSLSAQNYNLNFTPGQFKILPKPITITAVGAQINIGEQDPLFNWVPSELVNGDSVTHFTGLLSRMNGDTAGTYPLLIGTLNNPNYTIQFVSDFLTISKLNQSIQFDSIPDHLLTEKVITVYPASNQFLPITLISKDTNICSVVNVNTIQLKNVGRCDLEAIQLGNTTYQAAPSILRSFTIQKGNAIQSNAKFKFEKDGFGELKNVQGQTVWQGLISSNFEWKIPSHLAAGHYILQHSILGRVSLVKY